MAKVKIEGNTLDLDDSICKTDKGVKDALLPFYPAVANATIKRETKEGETTITVTKKAGTKGLDPVLAALAAAPETVNPILLLEATGKRVSNRAIEEALLQTLADESQIVNMVRRLDRTNNEPSTTIPKGF